MNTTKLTIQYFWRHAARYPWLLWGMLVALPLTILAGSYATPLIVANVLKRLSTGNFVPHNLWASFGWDIVAYAIFQLGSGMVGWRVVNFFAWRLEGNVERDIAREVFDHLLAQSPNFHANRFGGSLVSQTNKLMGSYIRFADTTAFQVIPLFSGLVFSCLILLSRSPVYAAILAAFSVIYVSSSWYVTSRIRAEGAKQAALESKQTGNLADAVSNVMAIKSFAGALFERMQFHKTTDATHDQLMVVARAHEAQQLYFSFMANGVLALSLLMAVVSALYWHADIATAFLIFNFTGSLTSNLFSFSNSALRNYNRSFSDAADMIAILQIEPEIQDPIEPEEPRISRGEIIFDAVVFRHEGSRGPLFKQLDLKIKAGEKVGLVGHSGSGKTTLTRLLLRFNDIQSGHITIDGQDICSVTQDDLRRRIAYVPQEPILFHRSLQENISYGNPDATLQEVRGVAKLAHAHEFIEALPERYKTLVGERGVKLSGGQRQRIAIARAMLKNAPILVLDEATAALDSESEALIQDALWKLMEGRTAIVVAHRLSTIQKMDRIVVLEDGKVIEQGTHKELLSRNGTYAKLWQRQSGGFIED